MLFAVKRAFLLIGATAGAIIAAGAIAIGHPVSPVAGTSPTPAGAVAKVPAAPMSDNPAPSTPSATYGLPGQPARVTALKHRYDTDPGFRNFVADYNAWTGHPNRGESASLAALSWLSQQGAPMSALIEGVQPRPAILRALQEHWRDQAESARPKSPANP